VATGAEGVSGGSSKPLRGYFDESGAPRDAQHGALAVAGYVGPQSAWAVFQTRWLAALSEFNVPYLHMRELTKRIGAFTSWTKDGPLIEERVGSLLGRLAGAIGAAELKGFGATVVLRDVDRFNEETGIRLEPKAIALYACALEIRQVFPSEALELLVDRMDRGEMLLKTAMKYGMTDKYYTALQEFLSFRVLPKVGAQDSRNTPGLQAADFLAWEVRKNYELKRAWVEGDHPSPDSPDWSRSLFEWHLKERMAHMARTGETTLSLRADLLRRSLSALADASPIEGAIWDYRTLSHANAAHCGIWE
jgi:hypothetical protein